MGANGVGVIALCRRAKVMEADCARAKYDGSAVMTTILLTPSKVRRVIFAIELRGSSEILKYTADLLPQRNLVPIPTAPQFYPPCFSQRLRGARVNIILDLH